MLAVLSITYEKVAQHSAVADEPARRAASRQAATF